MVKPDNRTGDLLTQVNVKAVRVSAWGRARAAAVRQGQTQGEWLSRACDHLANLEDGVREIPPGAPVKPTKELLAEIAPAVQGNLASMTREARSSVCTLIDTYIRESMGLPPRPVRLPPAGRAAGQSQARIGQSKLLDAPGRAA